MTNYDTSEYSEDRLTAWRRRALIIWSIIGVAVIMYFMGIALKVLALPFGIIIWTVVVVFLLRWQVEALAERGLSRFAATSISFIVFIAILALIGGFLFSPVVRVGDQFQGLINGAPDYFQRVIDWSNDVMTRYSDLFHDPAIKTMLEDIGSSATEFARNLATSSVTNFFQATSLTLNMLLSFVFGLVVAFWLLLEMPAIEREMHRMTAGKHAEDFHFFAITMSRAVGGFLRATFVQCTLIAIASMIVFYILRVPNPVALAVLVGIVNVVPVVGSWIAAALVFLALVFNDTVMAILAAAILIVIQRLVYVFVSPKLMGDSVDVHPALVIIAMMIGYAVGHQVGGLLGTLVGMLLSIPLAAVAKASFVYYFEKKTGRRLVAEDGVFFKGQPAADGSVNPAMDAVLPAPRPSVKDRQARTLKQRIKKKRTKE